MKNEKFSRMGETPVKKLMLSMGIPAILSMMMQALYNIVDSAFVSNMAENGELALNALTLAFPMQILMVAAGLGTGIGVNALLSKSLGQGNHEKANRVCGNGIFLCIIIYFLFLLFGIFGAGAYIRSQTKNAMIADMGAQYMHICCCVSMGIVFFSIFEKLLQATGHTLHSTIAQVAGALANIILDPIMIYGWLGLPAMGVSGAAWATVIGQILSALLGLIFHLSVNKDLKLRISYLKPSGRIIKEIYAIGLPAFISQALLSVMTYGLNLILGGISEAMVTAYGLYYKVQQFILFAAFGLRDAITPIVSFAHGMRSRERIRDGVKYGQLYTLAIMVLGLLIVEVLAVPFSKIFGLSGTTQQLCIDCMHIISISFLFAGVNIAYQGIFQALDGGTESLIISLLRQLVLIFPFAFLFAALIRGGSASWLMWLTFPIAEAITALTAVFLMKHISRKTIDTLV